MLLFLLYLLMMITACITVGGFIKLLTNDEGATTGLVGLILFFVVVGLLTYLNPLGIQFA